MRDPELPLIRRTRAARDSSWVLLAAKDRKILLDLLDFGEACVLHMPGELFVEYQLAAQKMRPETVVAMTAYGDFRKSAELTAPGNLPFLFRAPMLIDTCDAHLRR